MEIKVLGTGCKKCKALEKLARQAVDELGLNATVEKVEDMVKIMEFGVMATPALVINNKVVMAGKLPQFTEIKSILASNN